MKKKYLTFIYIGLIIIAFLIFFYTALSPIRRMLIFIIIIIYVVKTPLARLTSFFTSKKIFRIAISSILNIIWIFFLFWFLFEINVDFFIALLSFFIVAISFTMREVMNNMASGMLMLTQEPFEIGDLIETNNIQGRVVEINLNYTKIKEFDGVSVVIPNSNVYGSLITKFSHTIEQALEFSDERESEDKSYRRYLTYFGNLISKNKKITRYAKSVQIISELDPKDLKPRLNEIFEKYEDTFGIRPDYVVDTTTHNRLQLDLLITATQPELLLNYIDPFLRDLVFNLFPDLIYEGWEDYKKEHNIREQKKEEKK